MRILVDGTYLTTKQLRGIGRYTQTLCMSIRKFDIGKLYVLVPTASTKCIKNVKIHLGSIDHKMVLLPLPGRFFNLFARYVDIYSIVKRLFAIDVIHVPFERYYKTKSENVMTVHGMEPFLNGKDGKFFKDFRENLLASVPYVSKYIAVSGSVKSDLVKFLSLRKERVSEIPIGLDSHFFTRRKETQDDGPLRILYYGGFEENKNLKNLVKALDEVYRLYPDLIRLRFVGDAKWHFEQIGISLERTYIVILGYLDRQDLIKEILQSSCVIIPSIYEGYGLPLIESLSLQTPVLTSRNLGALKYVNRGYISFDPSSHRDISNAVLRYNADKAKIETEAVAESENVKARLNLKTMAEQLKATYKQII